MNKRILLFALSFLVSAASILAQPYFLRGTAAPCGWGNTSGGCQLTDPDNNGTFELTVNLGAPALGLQEFKIFNQGNGSWFPGGANAWFSHNGGLVTFRINSATNAIDVVDGPFSLCAPGAFSGWNNATPMTNVAGNTWCYAVPSPGTYEWKPTRCGSWASWNQTGGDRSMNSGNWVITTTTPNEQVCVNYDPVTGRITSTAPPPTGYYVRGTFSCGWNNISPDCKLTGPDANGCYTLSKDLTGTNLGFQEFKIYHADTDQWYPSGANSWFNYIGGAVTFKFCSGSGEVDVIDNYVPTVCAPGDFSGWDNTAAMSDFGDGIWCIAIPTPGTYQWKPVVCGTWNSWQPTDGTRSQGSDNWTVTTTTPNQQVCVIYDVASGRLYPTGAPVPTMSEWGLGIFAMLIMCLGIVTLRQRKLAAAGGSNAKFSLFALPFNAKLFAKCLIISLLIVVAAFAIAILAFGYQMTSADTLGSMMAIPVFAYLLMLLSLNDEL